VELGENESPRIHRSLQERSTGYSKGEKTYVTSVAILLIHDIKLATIPHPSSCPCIDDGCRMIGPTPLALTIHQMKNTMPAIGVTMDLRVKRCRLRREEIIDSNSVQFITDVVRS
jgi:hypothetical protein